MMEDINHDLTLLSHEKKEILIADFTEKEIYEAISHMEFQQGSKSKTFIRKTTRMSHVATGICVNYIL